MSKQTPKEAFNYFTESLKKEPVKKDTQDTQQTEQTQQTYHQPIAAYTPIMVRRTYRVNMAFDSDLEEFIKEQAWLNRVSVTEYINKLVRREMNTHQQQEEV